MGKDVTEVGTYNEYKDEIIEYFKNHIRIKNNNIVCTIHQIDIPYKEWYEILSRWLGIEYTFACTENIGTLEINLDFFTDFPLQTNRLSLLDTTGKEIYYKVGTVDIRDIHYTVWENIVRIDTDRDGVDDEEEKVYKTDPNNRDSDGDFYLDGEEINHGWLPMNPSPSPGQERREVYPESFMITPGASIEQHTQKDYSLIGASNMGKLFENILKKIGMTVSGEEKSSFFLIFIFTVFLGFLHAIWPWHAKWLLSGIMIHKKASFHTGMRFILIFSLTHIIDILLLFWILKFLLLYIDTWALLGYIQKWSSIILLGLWVYLLWRAFSGKVQMEDDDMISNGKITLMAIIAGLAPCSFWWSLFFMLISLGKISWIPWLIFAIALGIFLCLFLILCIITYTKKHSYSRFSALSLFSVKVSALFIFCIGLYLTKSNFIL